MRRCGIAGPAHTAQDRQIGPGCPAWNPTLLRQDIAAFTQKLCRGCFESMHYRLCTCPVLARQMPTHSTASLTARSALHLSTLYHVSSYHWAIAQHCPWRRQGREWAATLAHRRGLEPPALPHLRHPLLRPRPPGVCAGPASTRLQCFLVSCFLTQRCLPEPLSSAQAAKQCRPHCCVVMGQVGSQVAPRPFQH